MVAPDNRSTARGKPRQSSPRGAVLARPQVEDCRSQAVASRSDRRRPRSSLEDLRASHPYHAPIRRPAHQHQAVGLAGRPTLSELAGGGGHIQNHQGAAHHAADLPQNRCGHPRVIFCTFLAVLLRKELFDRLAARRHGDLQWQHIVDDLDELSEVAVEQDGRRALLRTAPGATIDPLCRALGITLPPVCQEIPPAAEPARSCGA